MIAFLAMNPSFPTTQAAIGGLGPWELGIILVIVLVVFGAGRLPAIGGSIGQAIKNFKKSIRGLEGKEDKDEKNEKDKPTKGE